MRAYPDRLVVVGPSADEAEQPVILPRSFERGQTLYDWRHYVSLLQRKPGALRNGAPFKTMPEPLQHLQAHLLRHPGGDRVMAQVLMAITLHGLDDVLVAVELALQSGRVSADHVLNVLARLKEPQAVQSLPEAALPSLTLQEPPQADVSRYDRLRQIQEGDHVHDIAAGLKGLSLHGMASAWPELLGIARLKSLDHEALLHQLIKTEGAHREVRSMAYQMRCPIPSPPRPGGLRLRSGPSRTSAGASAPRTQVHRLSPQRGIRGRTGHRQDSPWPPAWGIHAIRAHGKRVRFFSTVELVNMLESEKALGKAGQLAHRLMYVDLVILDEMGYLPFSQAGGALLFHLLSKLYERTSVVVTTNLSFSSGPACSATPR